MKRLFLSLACVLSLGLPIAAQTDAEKKQTIDYLRSLQDPGGGFKPKEGGVLPSVRATSSAVRALKYFGGEVHDRKAAARFIAERFDKSSGVFLDVASAPPEVGATAIGLMAVIELKMPLADYEPGAVKYLTENAKTFDQIRIAAAAFEVLGKRPAQADAWLKQVATMQNKDGTYGEGDGLARATGGAMACWLRLGGKIENPESVLTAMRKGQRADGGFGEEKAKGSDLETSYRVMRAFHMLEARPDADNLRRFIAKCRNADGGYGRTPGEPSTVSATYYAGIILHWLK